MSEAGKNEAGKMGYLSVLLIGVAGAVAGSAARPYVGEGWGLAVAFAVAAVLFWGKCVELQMKADGEKEAAENEERKLKETREHELEVLRLQARRGRPREGGPPEKAPAGDAPRNAAQQNGSFKIQ